MDELVARFGRAGPGSLPVEPTSLAAA
jgi:hypothetical protein